MISFENIAANISQLRNQTRNDIENLLYAVNEEKDEDKAGDLLDKISILESLEALDSAAFNFLSVRKTYRLLSPPVELDPIPFERLKSLREQFAERIYEIMTSGETYDGELLQLLTFDQEIGRQFMRLYESRIIPQNAQGGPSDEAE